MASKLGKFYGIGVGVGDPENITVKAAKRLHEVDVIVLPEAKSGEGSTAFNIVKEYVKPEVEQLFLEFPMIRDVEARKVFRKNNADVISAELEKGKKVAFLTIGDPMTYSTYTYVLEHISDDVEVETIAGITSFNSIAARLNIPLMVGDEDLKVVFKTNEITISPEYDLEKDTTYTVYAQNIPCADTLSSKEKAIYIKNKLDSIALKPRFKHYIIHLGYECNTYNEYEYTRNYRK